MVKITKEHRVPETLYEEGLEAVGVKETIISFLLIALFYLAATWIAGKIGLMQEMDEEEKQYQYQYQEIE